MNAASTTVMQMELATKQNATIKKASIAVCLLTARLASV
jgi:hypothetical protein